MRLVRGHSLQVVPACSRTNRRAVSCGRSLHGALSRVRPVFVTQVSSSILPIAIFGLAWGVFVPLANMLSFAPGEGWFDALPQLGYGAVGGWFALLIYVVLLAGAMHLRWRASAWQRIRL